MRRFLFILALSAAVLAAGEIRAQGAAGVVDERTCQAGARGDLSSVPPRQPFRWPEGNWIVTLNDYPAPGQQTVRRYGFAVPRETRCAVDDAGVCRCAHSYQAGQTLWFNHLGQQTGVPVIHNDGPERRVAADDDVDHPDQAWQTIYVDDLDALGPATEFRIKHRRGYTHSYLRPDGPGALVGRWAEDEDYDGTEDRGGTERWERVRPEIDRIEFRAYADPQNRVYAMPSGGPPALVMVDPRFYGTPAAERGEIPLETFHIHLYGRNLWGTHIADFAGAGDIERFGPGGPITDTQGDTVGYRLVMIVWDEFTPGRHELVFDGRAFPFYLSLDNARSGRGSGAAAGIIP